MFQNQFAGSAPSFRSLDTYHSLRHNMGMGDCMSSKIGEGDDIIGPKEASDILRVSRTTLWRYTEEGIVPALGYVAVPRKSGDPQYRATYSKMEMVALRKHWDELGFRKAQTHIKRRVRFEPIESESN